MSFLTNFADQTIITSIAQGKLEYIESDIFRFVVPDSPIIRRVIGNNDIGLDENREHFELHLYRRNGPGADNSELVASVAVPFSEGYLFIKKTEQENILRLGLTFWPGEDPESAGLTDESRAQTFMEKYLSDVPAGEYNCFIHFFSDELGTYNRDDWRIKAISPSRRELVLEWQTRFPATDGVGPHFDPIEYEQFAAPSIFGFDFYPIIDLLFQTNGEQQYQRLVDDFIDRLDRGTVVRGDEFELFQKFEPERTKAVLRQIFLKLWQAIRTYIDGQVAQKRFRITRDRFFIFLRAKIWEIVSEMILDFPYGGVIYVVDGAPPPPPEPPPDDDDGGGGPLIWNPPVSDGGAPDPREGGTDDGGGQVVIVEPKKDLGGTGGTTDPREGGTDTGGGQDPTGGGGGGITVKPRLL